MANDRMYIRCKKCGHIMFMARVLGYEYATTQENLSDRLDCFFELHAACPDNIGGMECPDFDLVYESDDSFDLSLDDGRLVDDMVIQLEKEREQGRIANEALFGKNS